MPANLRQLKKYWASEYEHRDLIAPEASYGRLRRAVEALGDTPLTASRQELQKAVNRRLSGNKQRDAVGAINQLLAWMGRRDAKLTLAKKERRRVRYLDADEVKAMVGFLSDPDIKAFVLSAFATGCRTGELFALKAKSKRDGVLRVEDQLDRNLKVRDTKNRLVRDTVIIPEFSASVDAWIAVPVERKEELRGKRFSEIVRRACKRAFPKDRDKHLTEHDLRHCYAIHLLNRGVSLSLVAQALGDSEAVANEYYGGFVLTAPGIEAIKQQLG